MHAISICYFIKIREKLSELMTNFEERRVARREHRLRGAAGATADTTAEYYGAGRRYILVSVYQQIIFRRGKGK